MDLSTQKTTEVQYSPIDKEGLDDFINEYFPILDEYSDEQVLFGPLDLDLDTEKGFLWDRRTCSICK
jgi:hypothetical protein